MLEEKGSLWDFHAERRWIVVPTNIGWKKDGCNVMGAGAARDAASLYPNLAQWYGRICQQLEEDTGVVAYEEGRLLLFPTKPLDQRQPSMSWNQNSDLELIKRSCRELPDVVARLKQEKKYFIHKVGLPLVGCGNGNLSPKIVRPLLHKLLDDNFVLLER